MNGGVTSGTNAFGREVVRGELVRVLGGRFTHPLTLIEAGAGFGKSTLLRQAVRANDLEPVGIDALVVCRPGDENAEQFASAVLAVLGCERDRSVAPLADLVNGLGQFSPIEVCVLVDDVHLLGAGSSAERLLGELVRALPAHAHLVLAGRTLPNIPTARLRAADAVVTLGEPDLSLGDDEVGALAALLGADASAATGLGGWPALVRLALAAGRGIDRQYLREEVLDELGDDDRCALFALTLLGESDAAALAAVTGSATDVEMLAQRVPLVRHDNGRVRAHSLWNAVAARSIAEPTVARIRDRATAHLVASGELAQAATIAIEAGEWAHLAGMAIELVRTTLTSLPIDTAQAWLAAVPNEVRSSPAFGLLDLAVRLAVDSRDPLLAPGIAGVLDAFRAVGETTGELVAVAVAALIAHAQSDYAALFDLARRIAELPPTEDAVPTLVAWSVPAVIADLSGDPDGTLAALDRVPWERVPPSMGLTPGRLRLQALWLAGRADEAVEVAEDLERRFPTPTMRVTTVIARWFAGRPTALADLFVGAGEMPTIAERDAFVASVFGTVMRACAGVPESIDAALAGRDLREWAGPSSRDSALATAGLAARALALGDEATARAEYAEHLRRFGLDDRAGERHLRRFPAIGVLCSEELDQHWRLVGLGPSHEASATAARLLLALRGDVPPAAELLSFAASPEATGVVATSLPLPQAAELVRRLAEHDTPSAEAIAVTLTDAYGAPAFAALRGTDPDGSSGGGTTAANLVRALPHPPAAVVSIRLFGPLTIEIDGRPHQPDGLRRSRVRQLLGLAVLASRLDRDEVAALLWPEMPRQQAAGNLRVTLTHLRNVLEPGRVANSSGFHLRVTATTIELHRSARLWVDLWRHRELVDHLAARSTADPWAAMRELHALRRGRPLPDLDDIGAVAPAVQHIERDHRRVVLDLGEARLAAGDAAGARSVAEEILANDPFDERAHRLAVAANLHLDDTFGARGALHRLGAALDELDVTPDHRTRLIIRRAKIRLGAVPV